MVQQEQVFNTIFKRELNSFDNESFLKNVVQEYPYFGAAYYFLLKTSFSNIDEPLYLAEKTALFFKNNFHLHNLLSQVKEDNIAEEKNEKRTEHFTANINEEGSHTAEYKETLVEAIMPVEEIVAGDVKNENTIASLLAKEEIMFEPLHASDYFASQGIKLSEEMLGTDKLGKQLKSFTAWLKTMKKVQPGKVMDTSIAVETAMQTLAEKSNKEETILTEAMAEAYQLQGKQNKAKEIYEKLSLQNPAKSAYFAAKIESLK